MAQDSHTLLAIKQNLYYLLLSKRNKENLRKVNTTVIFLVSLNKILLSLTMGPPGAYNKAKLQLVIAFSLIPSLISLEACPLTLILTSLHRPFHELNLWGFLLPVSCPEGRKLLQPMSIHDFKSELLIHHLVQLACMPLNLAECAGITRPNTFYLPMVINPTVDKEFLYFTFLESMFIRFIKGTFKLFPLRVNTDSSLGHIIQSVIHLLLSGP